MLRILHDTKIDFIRLWRPAAIFSALLVLPAVIALIAENTGHVKAVAEMTGEDLDPYMGRAIGADGLATAFASAFGGSPTTTYAENIGVMGATRVYSTAAYYVAAAVAILLGLCPKFGAIVNATPGGVLGGITVVLYGMIGLLGAKIWKENGVDFGRRPRFLNAEPSQLLPHRSDDHFVIHREGPPGPIITAGNRPRFRGRFQEPFRPIVSARDCCRLRPETAASS